MNKNYWVGIQKKIKRFSYISAVFILILGNWGSIGQAADVNNAQFVSQSVPSAMIAGQSYSVSVTMQNNGTTTWQDSLTCGSYFCSYRLLAQNPANNTIWGYSRPSVVNSVAPGTSKTFTFNVTAPATPGTYHVTVGGTQTL